MSENELILNTEKTFEDIKHIDEKGIEFWYARELMITLGYKDWRYFNAVIEKAILACKNSDIPSKDHFGVNNKMVQIGSGAEREQKDYKLSRYACYLIAQNANPRLKAVAYMHILYVSHLAKYYILYDLHNYINNYSIRV